MNASFKPLLAELIGTYAIVAVGCGAIVVDTLSGSLSHVGVAIAFGLVVMCLVATLGHISGAHFNPAVTVAFAATGYFPWSKVLGYVVAQIMGAILGALTLRLLFGNVANLGATLPAGDVWQSFGLEILLTALLMFVIISVATDPKSAQHLTAIAIGATVLFDAMWGGPISGASMNPARSIGPALISGMGRDQWIYIVAPVIGALIGAALYQAIRPAAPTIKPTES